MRFISPLLKGIVVGVSNVIPGVSAGTFLVLLGIYDPLLEAIGNILTDSLYDIWYASPILWKIREPSNLKGLCSNCKFIPICRGCRAMALSFCGDWLGGDPQCWIESQNVRA